MHFRSLLHVRRAHLPAMLLACAVAASVAGGSRAADPSAAAGLVGAYSFDAGAGSSVADSSGSANTGTVSGATWTAGKTGNALSFDGSNDWVTIADSASLDLSTGMTLEAWVKPTGQDSIWRTVVTKETNRNLTYGLFSNSETSQPAGIATLGLVGTTQTIVRGTSATAAAAWTHLATTFDGATLRFYVNGAQVSSGPAAGSMANSSGALRIGGNAVWAEWFSGQIDDLRIYNRALAATELQADMNTPVAPPSAPGPPPADTQAPTAPSGLAVAGQTQTQLTLSWGASTDNTGVTGYSRYRNGTLVASGTGTSYTFTGLACGTSYALAVDAYDAAGNRSTRPSVTASTQPCALAPVAAYAFNGSGTTVTDSSGRGNAGTISGAIWTTAGKSGGALSFDGVNDWVTIADTPSLSLTNGMTLEAWVKPTTAGPTWRTVVTKETTGNLTYGLFSGSDNSRPAGITTIGANSGQSIVRSPSALTASAWTHLATTYDGTTQRLYVNGAQVASQAVAGLMADSAAPLRIGGNAVWSEWFAGQIDDLRVYDSALTAAQVQADMNNPVEPASTPPAPPAADTQAPTAPGGLAVGGQTQTQATLSWNASTDNVGVAGYGYYRATSLVGNGTGTSYTFTGLACGTSYSLGVDAVDAAGNRSARSSATATTSACSSTPPPPPPLPPPPPSANTANLWVDLNGGSCARSGSARAYVDAAACGGLNAAYQAAANGDTILVRGGNYPGQTIGQKDAAAAPGITILNATGENVEYAALTVKGSFVRVGGFLTHDLSVDGAGNNTVNRPVEEVVVENFEVDGSGRNGSPIGYMRGVRALTWRNGEIHNNKNMALVLADQDASAGALNQVTLDRMSFHDALLDPGSAAHTECLYAQGIGNLRITNSHFYRCAVMDVFITRWTGTNDDAVGGYIENNIFETPLSAGNACCASNAFHFRNGGEPAPDIDNWDFRYNVFAGALSFGGNENAIKGGGLRIVGNTFLGSSTCKSGATWTANVHGDGSSCGGTGETTASAATIRSGYVGYVGSTASNNNWRLTATSMLIDKGTTSAYPALDSAGNSRYSGSAPDAGPFEYKP